VFLAAVPRQGFAAPLRALDPMRHRATPDEKEAAKRRAHRRASHGFFLLAADRPKPNIARARGANAPMLDWLVPRKPASMLACRATRLRLHVGPIAFGNALGESLAGGALKGSQQEDALGTVYNDGDIARSELRVGKPYQADFPAIQQFVGAFGDGTVSQRDPSNDVLLAAGDGFTMGRGRISISPPVDRKVFITDDLAGLSNAELIARSKALLAGASAATGRVAGSGELSASVLYQQGLGDIRESVSVINPSASAEPFATPDSVAAGPMAPVASHEDSIRALTDTEAFFTFNPAGKFLKGVGEGVVDLAATPVKLAKEAVLTTTDTIGHSVTGTLNWLTDSSLRYRSDSGLYRSVERNGVLGTVGLGITGTVKGLVSPIDALYRRDAEALGRSGPGTLLAAAGPLGWARRTGAAGVSFEDALVLQGDASRARIVQQIGEAAQPSVDALLKLDPNARVGFRGSLASGLKGTHKLGENMERVPFDGNVAYKLDPKTGRYEPYTGPQGYDADFFVVSDKLAEQLGNSRRFMDAARLDRLLKPVFDNFGATMQANPVLSGMKPGSVTFRVWSEDAMARKIQAGDSPYFFLSSEPQ
jgi:hypothetical protein